MTLVCHDCHHTWQPPPANVDPETGEISEPASGFNLPDAFWKTRPHLEHIRQAAHARNRCADAVLIAVLARVATLTPHNVVLPPIVGDEASLNFFGAIVDASGGGKTTSVGVARKLVPIHRDDIVDPLAPGSGEGLIEAYFTWETQPNPDTGKKERVKRQTRKAAFALVDEGQALLSQKDRSGSTIMQTLRSAWSGADLGQHNASDETRRVIKAHNYRLAMILGFQLQFAAELIADREGGTPQRFVFTIATDPTIPDVRPPWPGVLDWEPPATITRPGGEYSEMTVHPDIERLIVDHDRRRQRGEVTVDALESHAMLVREKVAALLAILDSRDEVDMFDWELAGMIMDCSNRVRGWAIEVAASRARKEAEQRTRLAIERERAVIDDETTTALIGGARGVARKVHRDGPITSKRDLALAVSSKYKKLVVIDEMIDRAIAEGWIRVGPDGWSAGGSAPA